MCLDTTWLHVLNEVFEEDVELKSEIVRSLRELDEQLV